jgi:cytosine/adenosine deaminase-related metal-dependent hydrolase
VDEVLRVFNDVGLETVCAIRPAFGEPENQLLNANGKSNICDGIGTLPPIFIAHFRKAPRVCTSHASTTISANIAIGPVEVADGNLCILSGKTKSLTTPSLTNTEPFVDLHDYLLLPGLINAHDHLEFALFPRLGDGPYPNCSHWATDIHSRHADVIAHHRAVPRKTRLWWGALKNLLAGTTTVCHHNPFESEFFDSDFPVRVVRDFNWAHSLASDSNVSAKHRSTPLDQPFIVHAAEGTDESSANEIAVFNNSGALDHRSVLVHALALDGQSAALLNERGCSLLWCCSSSDFLYSRHHSADVIRSLKKVAIGTDSSLTSVGDLLDELRFIASVTDISPTELWALVTNRSADVLRLKTGKPSLLPDHAADLIAIRDRGKTPGEVLMHSSFRDVELVMRKGKIHLAATELLDRFPVSMQTGLQPLEIEGTVRWLRAPIDELLGDAETYLGRKLYLGGKRIRRVRCD